MTQPRGWYDYCEGCRRPLQDNLMAEVSGRCDHCREAQRLADNATP